MTINAQAFVPSDEIRKLTRGSYEHLIVRLTEAMEPSLVEIFGDSDWQIVSTFASHVLVLGENGECVRVRYENTKGDLKILGVEKYPVRTVTEASYITTEAKKIVDSFISNALTDAKERFRDLVKLVPAKRTLPDDRIVEGITQLVKADRPWKTTMTERAESFKDFLKESKASPTVSTKFKPLYESEVQTADMETYFTLVQEALVGLGEKLEGLQHSLEDALTVLKTVGPAIAALGESEVLTALDTFAQDLLSDIRSVYKVVQESIHQVGGVDSLGKIHDTLAEQFYQYEVAVRFVVEMTKSLAEANK